MNIEIKILDNDEYVGTYNSLVVPEVGDFINVGMVSGFMVMKRIFDLVNDEVVIYVKVNNKLCK